MRKTIAGGSGSATGIEVALPRQGATRPAGLTRFLENERLLAMVLLSPTVVLRRHLYPALTSAQIRRVGPTQEKRTFHSFRHTFAKRALETGAQITWLSRHLGHSSLKVTTDIYGHWERAERKLQAAKMEGAFSV